MSSLFQRSGSNFSGFLNNCSSLPAEYVQYTTLVYKENQTVSCLKNVARNTERLLQLVFLIGKSYYRTALHSARAYEPSLLY